jgi:hypothetical protein
VEIKRAYKLMRLPRRSAGLTGVTSRSCQVTAAERCSAGATPQPAIRIDQWSSSNGDHKLPTCAAPRDHWEGMAIRGSVVAWWRSGTCRRGEKGHDRPTGDKFVVPPPSPHPPPLLIPHLFSLLTCNQTSLSCKHLFLIDHRKPTTRVLNNSCETDPAKTNHCHQLPQYQQTYTYSSAFEDGHQPATTGNNQHKHVLLRRARLRPRHPPDSPYLAHDRACRTRGPPPHLNLGVEAPDSAHRELRP